MLTILSILGFIGWLIISYNFTPLVWKTKLETMDKSILLMACYLTTLDQFIWMLEKLSKL